VTTFWNVQGGPSTVFETIVVVGKKLTQYPSWKLDMVMEFCIVIIPFGSMQDHTEVLAWVGGAEKMSRDTSAFKFLVFLFQFYLIYI